MKTLLTVALTGLLATSSFAQMTPPVLPALVTATGEASIYAEPDEVRFSININTEGSNLVEAQKKNRELVSTAITYLKEQGVEERHIQTQYLNVNVQYRDRQNMDPRYYANQSIEVCLMNVDSYERISLGLLERGITGLNGPRFATSKEKALREQARVEAVKNARQRAEALAGALNQKIGNAYAIDDAAQSSRPPIVYARAMAMESNDMGSSGPGIATGEIEIKHQVTVSFYLRD